MPRALAPRGTNGNGEFIPMTAHVDVKCMLRRYLHLSATDPGGGSVSRLSHVETIQKDHSRRRACSLLVIEFVVKGGLIQPLKRFAF